MRWVDSASPVADPRVWVWVGFPYESHGELRRQGTGMADSAKPVHEDTIRRSLST